MTTPTTSYDAVPYDDLAFAQTHPDHLAALARLFGLQPPPVATCRALELGCASGANLIPMAFNMPGAEFVGVDLSQWQIDRGLETIRAVGMGNITLQHGSILDVTPQSGLFDYIICHGVFSWVESHVQDAILRIATQNLAPAGVAYISYNTYPGWHMREMVRHMMRYHTAQFDQPAEQIEQARALLTFLVSASDDSGPYGQLLMREAERLGHASDSYLYHEHLEQTNTPFYFHQFIERAERAGLLYLSEASVTDMLTSHFPPDVAETLDRISPDILHLEQYMDFVRNRLFRQTLLVHKAQRPQRALTPAFLHGLLVSSAATPDTLPVDLGAKSVVTFRAGRQRADVSLTATKAAFTILMERWPEAVDVDTLCKLAMDRAAPHLGDTTPEEARRGIMGDLFGGVMYGMVNVHTVAPNCTNTPSERPQAHPVAAYQAARTTRVVNAHHQIVELEPLALEVLKLADGKRTTGEILGALLARMASGGIVVEDDGQRVTSPEAARGILTRRLEHAFATLARGGVLLS
jgi:methyltransferase-like protein/cyclopropane fatty-acyl-phospholipid synthase-like methyltransferase